MMSAYYLKGKQKELLLENIKLIEIIESVYDGIFITDGNAVVKLMNRSYEKISGLSRDELLGKSMKELVSKGLISNSVSLLVIENKKPMTIEQVFATGKHVVVSGNPVFDVDGNIIYVVTSVRDLTEIVKLKDELNLTKQQRNLYQSHLELIQNYLSEDVKIIAVDPKSINVLRLADRVANMDTTVLLTGETGVGKNEIAKYIHNHSHRSGHPFVTINCAMLPESLIETTLFGYEEGAFTGAVRRGKPGLFETANGGTVFIDEIGELPKALQIKLLRVLEDYKFERVGSTHSIDVDIRVLVATNKDLELMIDKGDFRDDLFYRINIYPIHIPELKNRRGDIIPLATLFLEFLNQRYSTRITFSENAIASLLSYEWPGNVRELKNAVERAYIVCNKSNIRSEDLGFLENPSSINNRTKSRTNQLNLKNHLEEQEYTIMMQFLAEYGSMRKAAYALNMDPSTFLRKKNKYEGTNE